MQETRDPLMIILISRILTLTRMVSLNACFSLLAGAAEVLPSWNEGDTKSVIVDFVKQVPTAGAPEFVLVAERIATFDNDGTLWSEQPMLEVFDYMRANGFKTYTVSGGGIEFVRAWAENVYGIPPEQVISAAVSRQSLK
jgi:hypothetical protein